MIKNAREYRITKTQIRKFETALSQMKGQKGEGAGIHPLLKKAQEDALKSQLQDLLKEVAEYEALREGKQKVINLNFIEEVPIALIQARIASGLSQKELANRLDLKEQQIQRYEATNYSSASLARIIEVSRALNLPVREDIFLPKVKKSFGHLLARLEELGLNRDFIINRLVPADISGAMQSTETKRAESNLAAKAASIISRIFAWKPETLLGDETLYLDDSLCLNTQFKLPKKIKGKCLNAYTVYAHYLALLVRESLPLQRVRVISLDARKVRQQVLTKYGAITFENLLKYVWDLGILVLPLNDPGAFHGACWRVSGKNIIVLKQKTLSSSRWSFDLLHELYHAGQEPEKDNFDFIELPDNSKERWTLRDERAASRFAGDVLLDGRANKLAELCVEEAQGKVEFLKKAAQKVAARENILVDYLANYLAYRLTYQNINWWGTARNLQTVQDNPWETARDFLLQKIDFTRINKGDQQLLQSALSN